MTEESWRFQQTKDMPRLHPQSWRELRQLVKLHGGKALIRAIQHLTEQENQSGQDDAKTT